jgi:hypothetical protein
LIDNGSTVTLSLTDDIEVESISQQQLMLDALDKTLTDEEVKKQIRPLLEALLKTQPPKVIKSYSQTIFQITMPKRRYEKMGKPEVGNKMEIEIKRV